MDIIFKYYGIDWIGTVFALLATYLLGNKKRYAFLFAIVANLAYFIFSILSKSLANGIACIAFFVLNLRGYILWVKDDYKSE